MRVLVCGGRDYGNWTKLRNTLDTLDISYLIHGGAAGADYLAGQYAALRDIICLRFPADWDKYGKRAGYLRNKQMLDEGKPDLVVAFPGGKGTANMVKLAEEAGVKVIKIEAI